MVTRQLTINGKVQGVFFRASAKEMAEKLGLVGWVKNTREGYVEAVVTGTIESVTEFVNWCHKGPERAQVSDVAVVEKGLENFTSFKIIR